MLIPIRSIVVASLLLWMAGGLARAQTATTGAASGVTDITATLSGYFDPAGGIYETDFQWGTDTTYGTTISTNPDFFYEGPAGSVTGAPYGLLPNTTYHYRLVGWKLYDPAPSIFGQDMTFTTGAPATPPTINGTLVLTGIGKLYLQLEVPTVLSGGSAASVVLDYGTDTTYGSTQNVNLNVPADTSLNNSFINLKGLTPGTTYHVRCRATNGQGQAVTPDATFTTVAGPVLTTGAATNITDLGATLNGSLTTTTAFQGIYLQYGPTLNYGQSVQFLGFGQTSQAISSSVANLLPNTLYHFRVAVNDNEMGYLYGPDQVFTTAVPATPPTITGNVTVDGIATTEATVSVTSVFSGSSPASVTFQYGLTSAYGSAAQVTTMATNTSAAQHVQLTGLVPGTSYHVCCTVTNGEGSFSTPDVTFNTQFAPVVTTGTASGVTDLVAILNGIANAEGTPVVVSFQYGTSTSYGDSIGGSENPLSDSGDHAETAYPLNLLPNTSYHYRIVASDQDGFLYYGADSTFTTAAPATPPSAGNLTVLTVGITAATVQSYPVYAGSSPATVYFDYGTTSAYGNTVTVNPALATNAIQQAPQVTLTGLTPLTTYHVRCRVTNNEGTVTTGDATFTTAGAPAVTTGPVTNITDLAATFSGSVIPNGPSTTATLSFDYGTSINYGSNIAASPGSVLSSSLTPFTANVTGLLPSTTYHCRAKAYYAFTSTSFYGPDVTFTTNPPATPPTISGLYANTPTCTLAYLQANIFAGSSDATVTWDFGLTASYGTTIASVPATIPVSTSNVSEGPFTGLTPDTIYHYRCTATNAQGTVTSPDKTFITPPAPTLTTGSQTTVTDLTATLNGSALRWGNMFLSLVFEWGTDTTYGSATNAILQAGYEGDPVPVSCTATRLLPNTTYHFRLKGQTYYDNLWYYGQDQTFTTGQPATPPGVATGAPASLLPMQVSLAISSLFTGSSATTLSYDYGLDTTYGTTVVYPTVLPPGQAYQNSSVIVLSGANYIASGLPVAITGLTPGTTYHFRAKAVNNEGTAIGGDITFATPALPAVATTAATKVNTVCATLNGTYTAYGVNYTTYFDYGPTTDYGTTVQASSPFTFIGGGNLTVTNTGTTGGTLMVGTGVTTATTVTSGSLVFGGGGNIFVINPSQPLTVSYLLTGLTPNTTLHYRFKITDSAGNTYYGDDMTLATITTLANAQNWRQQYFGSPNNSGPAADTANPSGDGIPNLVKYAFDLDPTASAVGSLPQPVLKTFNGLTYLDLTFQRDSALTDITYAVQAADSPAGPWTTIASSVDGAVTTGPGFVAESLYNIITIGSLGGTISLGNILTPPPPTAVYVEVHDIISTTAASSRFLRLQITRP